MAVSRYSEISAALVTAVESAGGLNVHAGDEFPLDWNQWYDAFRTPGGTVEGWIVDRLRAPAEWLTNCEDAVAHRWRVRGVSQVIGGADSGVAFQSRAETIVGAIRGLMNLDGLVEIIGSPSIPTIQTMKFGEALCHVIDIEFDVHERLERWPAVAWSEVQVWMEHFARSSGGELEDRIDSLDLYSSATTDPAIWIFVKLTMAEKMRRGSVRLRLAGAAGTTHDWWAQDQGLRWGTIGGSFLVGVAAFYLRDAGATAGYTVELCHLMTDAGEETADMTTGITIIPTSAAADGVSYTFTPSALNPVPDAPTGIVPALSAFLVL